MKNEKNWSFVVKVGEVGETRQCGDAIRAFVRDFALKIGQRPFGISGHFDRLSDRTSVVKERTLDFS